jgi:hypothetical protein
MKPFLFVEHDLIRKPGATFRDHAQVNSSAASVSAAGSACTM